MDVIIGDYNGEVFDNQIVESIDWGDTELSLEFRKNDNDIRISIQDKLLELLIMDSNNKYVIFDHGTGEMADFITVEDKKHELFVELYHVKKKSATGFNNSVGDVYEVAGQALKSVSWFTSKSRLLDKMIDRHNSGHCIVKKGGDFEGMMKELKTSGKVLRGCICIVQPGISKKYDIPDKIQEVLAATDSYIRKAGKVNRLRIIGS